MDDGDRPQEPLMPAGDALALYRLLDGSGVQTWINGGWAVDALVGRQTRPHRDLDIFVLLEEVQSLRRLLAADGFGEVPGGRPENFVLQDGRQREVDVHVFSGLDQEGNGLYPMKDGTIWVCPSEGLQGMGTILGHQVRCFTAELELQCHSGYELDEADRYDIARLREAFPHAAPLPIEFRGPPAGDRD